MDMHNFKFKGGVYKLERGAHCKFLLFLVSHGTEIPFWDGLNKGIIQHGSIEAALRRQLTNYEPHTYTTDCSVVKVFIHEHSFGDPRFMHSFYLALGKNVDGQKIQITPRRSEAKAAGYMFSAEARFLKKSEALRLFSSETISYKMLTKQQLPPVKVLREMITLTRARAVEADKALRSLRIR
jgi:hypothetical protein